MNEKAFFEADKKFRELEQLLSDRTELDANYRKDLSVLTGKIMSVRSGLAMALALTKQSIENEA